MDQERPNEIGDRGLGRTQRNDVGAEFLVRIQISASRPAAELATAIIPSYPRNWAMEADPRAERPGLKRPRTPGA